MTTDYQAMVERIARDLHRNRVCDDVRTAVHRAGVKESARRMRQRAQAEGAYYFTHYFDRFFIKSAEPPAALSRRTKA